MFRVFVSPLVILQSALVAKKQELLYSEGLLHLIMLWSRKNAMSVLCCMEEQVPMLGSAHF